MLVYGYTDGLIITSDALNSLTHESLAPTIVCASSFWKDRFEKDRGQETENPNILAERIQKRGGPITHHDVNSVIKRQGLSVTEEELNELVALPFVEHSLELIDLIRPLYRRVSNIWAVYMLISPMLKYYVGSTTNFGERLSHYFKNHKGPVRPILQDIRDIGINLFTLRVCDLPLHLREQRFLIALEQYYILALVPANNPLLVAGGQPWSAEQSGNNSRVHSVPLYLSVFGQVVYIFNSLSGVGLGNNAVTGLGTSANTIIKYIKSGEKYLGFFTISRTIPEGFTVEQLKSSPYILSLSDLLELVSQVKLDYKANWVPTKPTGRPKSTTPPITITRLSDNAVFYCDNYSHTRAWVLKETKTNIGVKTIERRVLSGQPLNGYLYQLTNKS